MSRRRPGRLFFDDTERDARGRPIDHDEGEPCPEYTHGAEIDALFDDSARDSDGWMPCRCAWRRRAHVAIALEALDELQREQLMLLHTDPDWLQANLDPALIPLGLTDRHGRLTPHGGRVARWLVDRT